MQSSANSLVIDSTQAGKSFINSGKSKGPNTVSCGTPLMTGTLSEVAPSTTPCWFPEMTVSTGRWCLGFRYGEA